MTTSIRMQSTERPILFSAPMVRGLLDGTKTQTRRVMRHQPQPVVVHGIGPMLGIKKPRGKDRWLWPNARDEVLASCPHGRPGDRLWVRESFDFLPVGGPDEPQACEIVYWATGSSEPRECPHDYNPMIYGREKVRPSIHMPRWASRITLEITGVRIERLQRISAADAIAEGVNVHPDHRGKPSTSIYSPVQAYRDLWERINGPDSWDENPWVWVIEFRRLEAGT